jgi:hypothetical protein
MEYCKTNDMIIETTAPHSSAQNGVAERLNRTLLESAYAMLLAATLLRKFWPEAVSYVCHIKNRVPTQGLRGMTPWEALTGDKPDLLVFCEFGSKCWVLDQSSDRGKLDAKLRPCLFIGLADNSKAYCCWDPEKNMFVKLCNIVFATIRPSIEIILPPPESTPKGERNEGSSRASDGQEAVADQTKSTKSADASICKSEHLKEVSRDKPAKLEVPSDAQIALT